MIPRVYGHALFDSYNLRGRLEGECTTLAMVVRLASVYVAVVGWMALAPMFCDACEQTFYVVLLITVPEIQLNRI